MNIFLVDTDPVVCAQALDDKRLNKMILETAQLLSGAYRCFEEGSPYCDIPEALYKLTHKNHPCAVWTRANLHNYNWLLRYFQALYDEKMHRTDKPHLSYVKLWKYLCAYALPKEECELPTFNFNCSKQDTGDIFQDYKQCLIAKWDADEKPTWVKRGAPDWYKKVKLTACINGLPLFEDVEKMQ